MTCESHLCKKEKHFCWLCGVKLDLSEHFGHYEKNNPFIPYCVNAPPPGGVGT
jgi:hypothetical protein